MPRRFPLAGAIVVLALGCSRRRLRGRRHAAAADHRLGPGTLRIGQHADFRSLDPAIANDTGRVPFVRMIFQPLLDYDDGVNLVPLLAEAMPTLSEDGKTYTFHLKKGVRFSNGREVTADDFVYSWTRLLDPNTKSPGQTYIVKMIVGRRSTSIGRRSRTSGERARN